MRRQTAFVAMATKRAHLKGCDDEQRSGQQQILSHAGRDRVVNINLYVKLMIPFTFTVIQRMKVWLFNKSNGVSFIYVEVASLRYPETRNSAF